MRTKFIITIICIAVFAGNLAAQDDSSSKEKFFKYGIKAGFDMSPLTLNFSEMGDQLQFGYQGGVFVRLGKTLYIQPEVYYAYYVNPVSSLPDNKIQTLRAPVMLGLRLLNLGIISLHLNGGPVFNALLSDVTSDFSTDKFSYNWQIGAGVDIFEFITADVRYTFIDGISLTDQVNSFSAESSTLNVTVGFKF